jgi:hypothetical protein
MSCGSWEARAGRWRLAFPDCRENSAAGQRVPSNGAEKLRFTAIPYGPNRQYCGAVQGTVSPEQGVELTDRHRNTERIAGSRGAA